MDEIKTGEFGFCPECGATVDVKIHPHDRLQNRITAAVARRGYRDGWLPGQFLYRQMAKLGEEYAEAFALVSSNMPGAMNMIVETLGDMGKWHFDHGYWTENYISHDELHALVGELSDMQVVMANAISAIEELLDERIDLMRLACEKAEADIERGVR